jgi:hypothetical protein
MLAIISHYFSQIFQYLPIGIRAFKISQNN